MQVFPTPFFPRATGPSDSGRRRALHSGIALVAPVLLRAAALGVAGGVSRVVAASGSAAAGGAGASGACPSLLNHVFPRLQDDAPVSLCGFAGKVLLVVNTASQCGFTPQYEGLERLHGRYASRGLVILGFPSNDFGQQEPGSNQAIADFCESTFGVRFPMFVKSHVVGDDANPLFKQLASATGERPRWNFHKYLVSRDGREVKSHGSATQPNNPKFLKDLERFLSTKS